MPLDLEIIPRHDAVTALMARTLREANRKDIQQAPILAEKLRHTYTKLLETVYPEYAAANGEVLPIDTSVNPAMLEWEYYRVDHRGFARWIDDDGHLMPGGASVLSRWTGRMAEMGYKWHLNFFDLERFSAAGIDIPGMEPDNARRAHDAKTNWTWLFGDVSKGLPGLCNHPNITKSFAPLNGAASSRLWANKTNDEILEDIELLISTIPRLTIRAHFAAKVFMSFDASRELKSRRLGAGDGLLSLWDYIVKTYSGDDTGQVKVTFKILNECDADLRLNPETNTDLSGIDGDFLLACPADNKDVAAFIRARPFTQLSPRQEDFTIHHPTHSKIGGCKLTEPLAFHRMDFGLT